MAGNRVYLQAGERITLPLKIQSLSPPVGYGSDASAAAVSRAPDGVAAKRAPLNAKSKVCGVVVWDEGHAAPHAAPALCG